MLPEQNLPWWRHNRPWGFRFSTMDGLIFAAGLLATLVLWSFVGSLALFVPFLLGHFFLFCNTFRIGGERTLIWVAAFLANFYVWTQTQNTWIHMAIQLFITAVLIIECMLGKNYHGYACRQINPHGFRSGAMSEGAFTRRVLLACRVPKPLIETLVGRRLEEFDPPSQ